MASLIETFVPFSTYNSLPHIKDVANVPNDNSEDLEDLRKLLAKHNVPKDVSIRLIHKHFDTQDGEVMTFDNLALPGYGTVQTMKPVLPSSSNQLRGIHYFVNDEGSLQAYEYAKCDVPNMTKFASFLEEFCRIVSERNLRHKFGLKLKVVDELDRMSWTEFELHQKRSTIMLQEGMPMPNGEFDHTVSTEWNAIMTHKKCKHCSVCSYCRHGTGRIHGHCKHWENYAANGNCGIGDDGHEAGFYLGGQRVVPGTPIFEVVNAIAAQAF